VKNEDDAGRFFGELESPTLETMVQEGVFERVVVYDYQGLCNKSIVIPNPNACSSMMTVRILMFAAS
jgi:hypothetical protein